MLNRNQPIFKHIDILYISVSLVLQGFQGGGAQNLSPYRGWDKTLEFFPIRHFQTCYPVIFFSPNMTSPLPHRIFKTLLFFVKKLLKNPCFSSNCCLFFIQNRNKLGKKCNFVVDRFANTNFNVVYLQETLEELKKKGDISFPKPDHYQLVN